MASRKGDLRWLVQHNGHPTWHCVKDVPAKLREAVGKPRLVKSLQTHDVSVARSRRWEVLREFERTLAAARAKAGPSAPIEAGLEWRVTMARIKAGDSATIKALTAQGDTWGPEASPWEAPRAPEAVALDNAAWDISEIAEHLAETQGAQAAQTFVDVARGHVTPLLHHLESWLTEGGAKGPLNLRTAGQYRTDVKRLAKWAKATGLPETIEAFTKSVVGRYVTETMVQPKVDPKTGNRWISAASSYWRWMMKRGVVEANPWQGQSLAKSSMRSTGGEKTKRPCTDAELRVLLEGSPDAELADLIRVAALSGMRVEEVYRLTVAGCADGWFNVKASKTTAGIRRVPVHSGLQAIVSRRCEGKAATAFLFHEAGPLKPGRERSMAVSKRFGTYRKAQGVHDAVEGRRASRVDFHSLRRWFITTARNANQDRAMVAAVVGHEAGNITDDVYSGGPSDTLRRAVVESVKLPEPASP